MKTSPLKVLDLILAIDILNDTDQINLKKARNVGDNLSSAL